jgi:hypothetical protein
MVQRWRICLHILTSVLDETRLVIDTLEDYFIHRGFYNEYRIYLFVPVEICFLINRGVL